MIERLTVSIQNSFDIKIILKKLKQNTFNFFLKKSQTRFIPR
jgi:hypothetical protein